MTERLRELGNDADPVVARAARLLSSVSRYEPPDGESPPPLRVWAPARGHRAFWARPAVVGALSIASTAAAGAAVGGDFIARAYRAVVAGPVARPVALEPSRPPAVAPPAQPLPAQPPPAPPPPASSAARPALPSSHFRASPAAPRGEGARLVLEAVAAVRREGEPERAARLLEQYLRRYPRGTLREEALALSIEAALARGDGAAARRLARRYEQLYPRGYFLELARRAGGARE